MQSMITSPHPPRRKRGGGMDLISWTTMRYRTVGVMTIGAILLLMVILAFLFPDVTKAAWHAVASKIANRAAKSGTSTDAQAHFTYMDGSVKVRKANSNNWITANYDTT